MAKTGLSKSRIIAGRQCPKRLYLETYHPELKDDSGSESVFATGNAFGELARDLFPDGLLIEQDDDLQGALATTEAAMADESIDTIFEATFSHNGVLIRTDILKKEKDSLALVEVKASTSVKSYHVDDCAVQAWVLKCLGHDVPRIYLGHVNREFVYHGDSDYRGILHEEDVTEQVVPLVGSVEQWVTEMREVLAGMEPETEVGSQCTSPYNCPFVDHCTPPQSAYPVTLLPYGGKAVKALLNEGYTDLRDVPEGRLTNKNHERVRRVTVSGQPELLPGAAKILKELSYPRYYLDFETVAFAVPIWANTRPYEMLTFQWSCHIEAEDGSLDHEEFLDISGEPPMRALAEKMIATLGDEGPVFMYTTFERHRIRDLTQAFPDLADELGKIDERLVDLHPLARDYYYHPDMKGSWSIKAVLPTVAPDLRYDELEGIQEGMGASTAYMEIVSGAVDAAQIPEVEASLLAYCKLDTLAMVRLARFLQQ